MSLLKWGLYKKRIIAIGDGFFQNDMAGLIEDNSRANTKTKSPNKLLGLSSETKSTNRFNNFSFYSAGCC